METKIMTQADIDAVKPDENGVKHFGDCCKFGDFCKFGYGCKFGNGCAFGDFCNFGNGCVILKNCTFGLHPKFGNRCCFCAPMDYLEYVERTNRKTHKDAHNALVLEADDGQP